ncbi:hypothetical protein PHSC3_000852 [Chlamydiales bacterium STE3]|nr:hypothetical protein PHSC3_000852 [Chlamydiales bacterium STE3]
MKKIFILLVMISSFLNASWEESWSDAVEACSKKEYILAEEKFNETIYQLEKTENDHHPHVYVDRARLFSLLNRDEEALKDLDIAMKSPLLKGDDLLRAVVTRLATYYRLNMLEEAAKELEIFKSIYPCPKLEVYEDRVIIRNIPDCEYSKEIIKSFVANTFCENSEDVKIINGICIAKRKTPPREYEKKEDPCKQALTQ